MSPLAAEFRSYFEYCRSLRFEDRPDYAYLKVSPPGPMLPHPRMALTPHLPYAWCQQRLFKELFYRKGYQYDNMFDWTVQNMVSSTTSCPTRLPRWLMR